MKVTTDKFACGRDAGIALWGETAVKKGEVHVMKNAINTKAFIYNEQTRKKKRQELNIKDKDTVIGSVGRLSYQKNSDFIIEIFNEYHKKNIDSVLVLIGEGDLQDKIQRKIFLYNLQNNVLLLESRVDVNEIMMAMDVFLLPSRFEGLPIVLVEAQCSGLQCFVSDTITQEIKLSEHVHYYGLENDAEKWATWIYYNTIYNNRENAYECVVNSGYDIIEASKELEKHYISILGKIYENII